MSDKETKTSSGSDTAKLKGIYAFKAGMSTVYNEQGEALPVTVLRFDKWIVSQVKTDKTDGYDAIQLASGARKSKNSSKSAQGHLKGTKVYDTGAMFVREIRQQVTGEIQVGQVVAIDSLVKGDIVKVTGRSKGRGFAGVVKRYNFAGGPGAHGSTFHRKPGSSGNRTWPGRVMPGKRFPGHFGDRVVTIRNVEVVDVLPEESVIILKGHVPGAPNTLVRLMKE